MRPSTRTFLKSRPMWRSWTSIRLSACFSRREGLFLDGADYFDTFRNLVYTRNIASPEYGAKITGKNGPHTSDFWQPTMRAPALSCRGASAQELQRSQMRRAMWPSPATALIFSRIRPLAHWLQTARATDIVTGSAASTPHYGQRNRTPFTFRHAL